MTKNILITALLDGILYAQKSDIQDLTPDAIDALLARSKTPKSH